MSSEHFWGMGIYLSGKPLALCAQNPGFIPECVCACACVCVHVRACQKKMQVQIQAVFSSKRSVINPGPDPGPPTAPPPVYRRDQSPQPLPPSTETRAQWTQREPEFQGLLDSSIPLFSEEKASPAPSLGLHCHSLKYSFDYENISH